MDLHGMSIGFCLTAAYHRVWPAIEAAAVLHERGAQLTFVASEMTLKLAGRASRLDELTTRMAQLSSKPAWTTISEAERAGPGKLFHLVIVAPCTGNTLARLANSLTDGPVTMTVKAHLRNQRPVLLAISTNDGLGLNAHNLAKLLNARNVFFVPFGQDNPQEKPNSLDADLAQMGEAVEAALQGRQLQPVLVTRSKPTEAAVTASPPPA
jgi:dipicolinate synthase subunit B